MWKLYHHSFKIQNLIRFSLTATSKKIRQCHSTKKLFTSCTKNSAKVTNSKITYSFSTLSKIGLALSGGIVARIYVNNNVFCAPIGTRMVGFKKSSEKEVGFNWALFWKYLKPYLHYFIAAIIGALIVAILNIEIPQVMGGVINVVAKYTSQKDSDVFLKEMKQPAIKLVAMYLAQAVFTFFYIDMLSNIGENMAYDMKKDLFASIIKQDIEFFDRHRTGEIINRLTSDIQEFKSSFKQTVSGGLRAATQIIGCSISLVLISPQMTFITLLCIPTVIAVGTAFGSILRKTSKKAHAQIEKTTAVADEAISNIRTVRAFAMEESERNLYEMEAFITKDLNRNLGFGIGIFQGGTNLFLNGMVLATLYMGGYLLSTDQLTAGELMAYLMATQTIQRSLGQISLLFGAVMRGAASGSRVFEFIELNPKASLTGGRVIPFDTLIGEIEFKDVYFSYPTRSEHIVLEKFNLKIPAGKTIAIVGASGNGKSTLVALLERFYDIKNGLITVDGQDIRLLDPTWLRQKVLGLISQEPVLFGTSVMENIRYGKPTATDEEVVKAAKLAQAHNFIIDFPLGYDTSVGERGAALSGGQKQRIAIARALLKDPKILILDEATSALDAESEKLVQHALDEASRGRTVIIIAHRLSTIKNADYIVVLNKGKIVEAGTHESLQKLRGYYYSITFDQQNSPAG